MKVNTLKSPPVNQNGYHKNSLTKERIGTLFIYPIDYTPDDCLSCDGYSLQITDYEDLYKVIGTKFNQSGDATGTFRVPDYNVTKRFLQPGSGAGTQIAAGLPNITGTFVTRGNTFSGCVYKSDYFDAGQAYWGNVNNDAYYRKYIDASKNSSLYGNSTTVQPPSQLVHICIKYK